MLIILLMGVVLTMVVIIMTTCFFALLKPQALSTTVNVCKQATSNEDFVGFDYFSVTDTDYDPFCRCLFTDNVLTSNTGNCGATTGLPTPDSCINDLTGVGPVDNASGPSWPYREVKCVKNLANSKSPSVSPTVSPSKSNTIPAPYTPGHFIFYGNSYPRDLNGNEYDLAEYAENSQIPLDKCITFCSEVDSASNGKVVALSHMKNWCKCMIEDGYLDSTYPLLPGNGNCPSTDDVSDIDRCNGVYTGSGQLQSPPTASNCTGSTPNWVDVEGNGCDYYEKNDQPVSTISCYNLLGLICVLCPTIISSASFIVLSDSPGMSPLWR